MAVVTMRDLLEAGVHFGHQTRRWNPKMKQYIFTERNGIYILNLQQTMRELQSAYQYAVGVGRRGGTIMFVGTKKQAQEPLVAAAQRAGMPYVTSRWLGGMLTNFETVRGRVAHMKRLEAMIEDGTMATLPKKEQILKMKELTKLQNNLNGIREMASLPSAIFIVDTKREEIAIAEARRLNIPIIAMVDTNSDPDVVDFPIPANDDAIRSVSLVTNIIADAVLEGNGGISAAAAVAATAVAVALDAPVDVATGEVVEAVAESDVVADAAPVAE